MGIPFTQYRRPNGRAVEVSINRPSEIEAHANRFIDEGGRFECEVLTTGEVSLTAVKSIDGEDRDVAIEVCQNGPAIPKAVDDLVRSASRQR